MQSPWLPELGAPGYFFCVGYVSPPLLVESWLLLALLWVGLTLKWTDCEDWPWPQCTSFCTRADTMMWNSPQQGLVSAEISLVEQMRSCSAVIWSQPLGTIRNATCALSSVVQLVGHHPAKRKVASSIPSHDKCLGCRFRPQLGHIQETANRYFSHALMFPSLPLSLLCHLSKNK